MYVKPSYSGRLKRHQAGMTTLGVVILVCFIGIFAFAGLRLTPIYLNYMKVASVVSGVQKEFEGTNATRSQIRSSISRRFDIESVGVITARDVTVTAASGGYEVAATYSHKSPFIANISFIVDFDNRALVRK